MRDFDAIFHELTADAEMARDFKRRPAGRNESPQRSVRNERRGAHRVSRFLVTVIVIASDDSLLSIRLLCRDNRQPVGRVSEENVRNLFH